MSGTKAGGMKAAATNKEKYGPQFYANIGRKGGQNGHTGGFAANPALAKIAGRKGGQISRRGPITPERKAELKEKARQAEIELHLKNIKEIADEERPHDAVEYLRKSKTVCAGTPGKVYPMPDDTATKRKKSIKLWYRLFGRHK